MSERPAPGPGAAAVRRAVQLTLVVGLAIACTLMIVGLLLAVAHGAYAFHSVSLGHAISGIAGGRATGFMASGLLVLGATPIASVIVLIVELGIVRDWRFLSVGVVVLLLLLAGAVAGRL